MLSSKEISQCITLYIISCSVQCWYLTLGLNRSSSPSPPLYSHLQVLLAVLCLMFNIWCLMSTLERWGVRVSWLLSCSRESGEDRGVTDWTLDWLTDLRDFHSFLVQHSLPIFTKIRQTPPTPVFRHNLTSDNRDIDILQTCNLKDNF